MLTFPSGQPTSAPATTNAPTTASSQAQIDLQHLRPTTKFDQLIPDLQKEIEALDTAILNQMRQASEVADLLPAVISAGEAIPDAVDFVSQKLDEVELGLENDAEAIVAVRDTDVKKGEGEAKCVFRAVDRLKVPRQYQVGHGLDESLNGSGVYGGGGLSGWWNNPQTLRGSVRAAGAQGHTMQLPGEDVDESAQGPKTLIELFNGRVDEMDQLMKGNRELLREIEGFVEALEDKVISKERELNERVNYGERNGGVAMSEKEHQMQLLRFVFGEVQRNLYDVAGKIGSCRDDVTQLALAG